MKQRIAIFSGYAAPFGRGPRYGGQIVRNPRPPLGRYGRPAYDVPAREETHAVCVKWAPARGPRAAYSVKKMVDTPAMKRSQKRMKAAARKCKGKKAGSFRSCMRKALKAKR